MIRSTGVFLVGGFQEVIDLLEHIGFEILGIIDTKIASDKYPVLGDDQWLLNKGPVAGEDTVVVSPDSPTLRGNLSEQYRTRGFELAVVNGGILAPSATVSGGVVIQQKAFVSANTILERGVKVNVGALVMHDVHIGEYTTVAPAAVLLGGVKIGDMAYIGSNATILPGLEIGSGATIGAGAVVTKDVPPGKVVRGIPAK
ncbi:hypothetical protein N9908_04920 [Akkermansiaceae bacterium]|nr:hypothetical protein [Akkermansiaceae bacterium]